MRKRQKIEQATIFKVQFAVCLGHDNPILSCREFKSLKVMRQWIDRNDNAMMIVILKTLALIDDEWEPFATIGKKTITLSDLQLIVRNLTEEYKPSKIEN